VKLGHHDLSGRNPLFGMNINGNAAAIVDDSARSVSIQNDMNFRRKAGQRLVDGVVDHLIDHVVEAGAIVRIADVHARAFADGVQATQNLNVFRAVVFGAVLFPGRLSVHVRL